MQKKTNLVFFTVSHSSSSNIIFWKWQISNLKVFGYFTHYFFLQKKHVYRPITFYTLMNSPFFLLKAVKHGVAIYLQILTRLAKIVAILFYFVSPSYGMYKTVWHVLIVWFEVMKYAVAKYLRILTRIEKYVCRIVSYYCFSDFKLSKKAIICFEQL